MDSAIHCNIPQASAITSDDEIDMAENAIKKAGASSNVLSSIKQELQRLSEHSPRPAANVTKF